MNEPPVRADGRCAVCGKPRKHKPGTLHAAEAALDSFCSADCCRAWHGCSLVKLDNRGRIVDGLEVAS